MGAAPGPSENRITVIDCIDALVIESKRGSFLVLFSFYPVLRGRVFKQNPVQRVRFVKNVE